MQDPHDDLEPLSEDPEENLRLENELTKLRLQAELGAHFAGNMQELPPEVEKQFLHQLIQWEAAMKAGHTDTIAHIIGIENLPDPALLTDGAMQAELYKVSAALKQNNISIVLPKHVALHERYRFLREDILPLEVLTGMRSADLMQGGATLYLDYLELYPDHKQRCLHAAIMLWEAIMGKSGTPPEFYDYDTLGAPGVEEAMRERMEVIDPEHDEDDEALEMEEQQEDSNWDNPFIQDLLSKVCGNDGHIRSWPQLKESILNFRAQFEGIDSWDFSQMQLTLSEATKPTIADDAAPQQEPIAYPYKALMEGTIVYTVQLSGGELHTLQGPAEIRLEYDEQWAITHFSFPGWVG